MQYLIGTDGATFAGTLVLANDPSGRAAFSTGNGYSSCCNVFGALEGEGSMSFSGNPKQGYVFNTGTNFTGSITLADTQYGNNPQGRRIVFGSVASSSGLPSVSPSITVMSGAAAQIGAGATWMSPQGVEVAGTLIVGGAGATLDCNAAAAMGLKLDDGATLRFETTDSKLTFAKVPQFASGTVNIAFAGGVAPTNGMVLVQWPNGSSIPAGNFAFSDSALAARWVLTKTATGLVVANAPLPAAVNASITVRYWGDDGWEDRKLDFDLPTEWITSYYPTLDTVEAVAAKYDEDAANGAKVWQCYMLGLDPTDAASGVSLSMAVKGNEIHFAVEGLGETHALDGVQVQWRMKTSTNLVADAVFSNAREYKTGLSPAFSAHLLPDTPADPTTVPSTKPAETLFYKITVTFVAKGQEQETRVPRLEMGESPRRP